MKRVLFAALGAGLLLGPWTSGGRTDDQDKVAKLMRRKLAQSQKVLEGIAVQDFKSIEKHAQELIETSREAGWRAFRTAQYEVYSSDFRRSARNLVENARKKNIDAAALSYVELTLTCVKCHKHVREIRMTGAE